MVEGRERYRDEAGVKISIVIVPEKHHGRWDRDVPSELNWKTI